MSPLGEPMCARCGDVNMSGLEHMNCVPRPTTRMYEEVKQRAEDAEGRATKLTDEIASLKDAERLLRRFMRQVDLDAYAAGELLGNAVISAARTFITDRPADCARCKGTRIIDRFGEIGDGPSRWGKCPDCADGVKK